MAFMEWNDSLSVGVAALDGEHQKLIGMVNELYESMKKGQSKEVMGKTLAGLISYCGVHFAHEEKLFAQTNYPATAAHKQEHENLNKQVLELQAKYKADIGGAVSVDLMNFLRSWLVNHIMGTDKKYTAHLNANGIK
jgi:hemerythrin